MNKELEKEILKIVGKYQSILLLNRNTFEIRYGTESKTALMESVFNYPYLNVILKYSDDLIKRWEKGENIVPYVVHEMCHTITDPFYAKAISRYVTKDEITDERELLTDYICNIVIKR